MDHGATESESVRMLIEFCAQEEGQQIKRLKEEFEENNLRSPGLGSFKDIDRIFHPHFLLKERREGIDLRRMRRERGLDAVQ